MFSQGRRTPSDGPIPAGYTYFGQFIFHDITWLTEDGKRRLNKASTALDMDSLLGEVKPKAFQLNSCPHLGPLPVGLTHGLTGPDTPEFPLPEDLPRKETKAGEAPLAPEALGFPLIRDWRNDDFLPLAQIHTLMLKFFNAIARWFGYNGSRYHDEDAKRCFIQHLQAVVLYDYLPRLIEKNIHDDVIENGRRIIHPEAITRTDPFQVPIEFASAVARFGHSMIRESYNWNKFNSNSIFQHFILLSHQNSSAYDDVTRMTRLPRDWVVDWSFFFDLPAGSGASLNMARRIDTRLESFLKELPERIRERDAPIGKKMNLAQETLFKQHDFAMVSAQNAIKQMNGDLGAKSITPLTPSQLASSDSPELEEVFRSHPELIRATPLWYYTLKEAEILHDGECLGPMASRIVMETLHASIEASDHSILRERDWAPKLPRQRQDRFTLADVALFSGNVNPLG